MEEDRICSDWWRKPTRSTCLPTARVAIGSQLSWQHAHRSPAERRGSGAALDEVGAGPPSPAAALFGLWPIAAPRPIPGFASVVLDGENKHPFLLVPIDDVEGKPRYSPLTLLASRRSADVGRLCDLRALLFDDSEEPKTKPRATLFIEASGFDHLSGRCAVEINWLHRSASRAR